MNLNRAEARADSLIKELLPFCERIEKVGKIRRRKPSIDKVEVLLAPKGASLFGLMTKLTEMGSEGGFKVKEKRILLLKDEFGSIPADLYFTSLDKWPVVLLLKTGGAKSNKKIEQLCWQKKWHLSAEKGAIFNEKWERLPIETEEDIFKLLEIKFTEPNWRE